MPSVTKRQRISVLLLLCAFTIAQNSPACLASPKDDLSAPIIGSIPDQTIAEEIQTEDSSDENSSQSSWSLPILGQLLTKTVRIVTVRKSPAQQAPQAAAKDLQGTISFADPYTQAADQIDELLTVAMDRNANAQVIERAVTHFRKPSQQVIAETKDAVDYLIPYRGFGPSSEAGDIILGEKLKLKSKASAEYARQKLVDETHVKVVSSMMQLAMGLGMTDTARGAEISQSGFDSLQSLVGEEEALKTKAMLARWVKDLDIPEQIYSQKMWDVAEKQQKQKAIVESSLEEDNIVREIKRRIHKYNHKSKFAMASSHVVQASLAAVSLTPTFVGPAAKLALMTYIMATGGPEQVKLLKELYLDKRFESRCRVINEEAHLALDNYQLGLLTRNPALIIFSESLIGQMAGEMTVQDVLGKRLLAEHKREPGA